MNDSGGDPVLFLTDTLGTARGIFPVGGASNIDWESLGRGPCGSAECLVIGDTGDNSERRPSITLYRVPEPTPGDHSSVRAARLEVTYPDGPHDVEALYVEPDGAVILVSKGRRHGVLVFRVPAQAWSSSSGVTAVRIDSLPITASMATGEVVTDAAISPDGTRVAVRTYRDIRFFSRSADGHLTPESGRPVCDVTGMEPQGEGIDWFEGNTLVLTSERGMAIAGTISLVQCPVK
jgi:hypothetical protein